MVIVCVGVLVLEGVTVCVPVPDTVFEGVFEGVIDGVAVCVNVGVIEAERGVVVGVCVNVDV